MNTSRITPEMRSDLTYESIVEGVIDFLQRKGLFSPRTAVIPWEAFLRLSTLIHESYEIPSTTFTPIMRRLLFSIGVAHCPHNIVGVGTYVGYTFSWLLRNRFDNETEPFFQRAVGIDIDSQANTIARRNCSVLGHGDRLAFIDADGVIAVANQPIDLLYIDLDDPVRGKAGYQSVLEAALTQLQPGALVLAHDACVQVFEPDFAVYPNFLRQSGLFSGPWILRVDSCGLSIAMVR